MTNNYKPVGYNSVSPYFIVDGAQNLIDLLVHIFDAEQLRKYNRPDGTIMHSEIKIDDSVLMFSESSEEYPANKLLMHIYVQDVDMIFQKAIKSGCELLEKPKHKDNDPDKRGSFKDFAGNIWSVATQIKEGE